MMIILWSVIGLFILSAIVAGAFFNWRAGIRLGPNSLNAELVVDEAFSAKDIDTVKIDLVSDMCRILTADGENIVVKHYARGVGNNRYAKVSRQNGTLTVSTRSPHGFDPFYLFVWNNYSMVEIYLPKSYRENLAAHISSGTLTFEDELDISGLDVKISSGTIRSDYSIKTPDANISVNSGTIKLTGGVKADNYAISVSSGTVNVNGIKGSGDIEVNSGSVRLTGTDIEDHLSLKVSSGTINIGIAGDPPLEFTGHKSSGTIHTYFATFDSGSSNFSATTGQAPYKKLDVRVNSGTIRITQD